MATLKITKDNFQEVVLDSDKPVLLDFWAEWCGPCRMIGPVIDEIAQEVDGTAKVGKINIDEESELASQFRVMTIPTLMVIRNGEVEATAVGVKSKEELLKMLEQ